MNRIWMASLSLSVVALAACSSVESTTSDDSGGTRSSERNAGAAPPGADPDPGGSTGASGGEAPQAGTLTAGVWDDNLNFDFFKKYLDSSANLSGLLSFSLAERESAMQRWTVKRTSNTELDVAFLIDVTGSMGDELRYLQTEVDGIAQRIKTKFPSTTPRFGLVVYRDHDDAFVTRSFDFTNVTEFQTKLGEQMASGGGDFPEAVPEGLDATMKLSWRTGGVARLAFWVADAPHHTGTEQSVQASIAAAVAKDVHIYPVAASGTDDRTEFTMRTAAQLTGGRYVFLTDDSGVGYAHAEPHIPCYHVTRFDGAIVRMVESEMTGTHVQPSAGEIIRSVGNPVDGQCSTKSSGDVTIY